MKSSEKINTTYKEYLETLKKNDITKILDFYNIKYKKNLSKEKCINLVNDNISLMVDLSLGVFQKDELANIKYVIKKKGYVVLKINYLLHDFLENLTRNYLIIKLDEKKYYMPSEILKAFEHKVGLKASLEMINKTTQEYELILGYVDAYGVIDYDIFYENYAYNYKLTKEDALDRIKFFSEYFKEFKLYTDKKKHYLTSNIIETLKDCKKYLNKKEKYKVYSNEDIMKIHNFKYMESYRSYKKLIKYIKSNYNINNGSIKIVIKKIFIPYLDSYQLDKNVAKEKLFELIDTYFEIKKGKQKDKLAVLIENMAMDYPSWRLNGYSEKEHV